jgi:hypothetical protein
MVTKIISKCHPKSNVEQKMSMAGSNLIPKLDKLFSAQMYTYPVSKSL